MRLLVDLWHILSTLLKPKTVEVPTSIPIAPPQPTPKPTSAFDKALTITLGFEGGYVNSTNDAGGATNHGITQRVYDHYRKEMGFPVSSSVESIADEEVANIYETEYWHPCRCDSLPPQLATALFDTSANLGVSEASKLLQRVVGVTDDGVIGPATVLAVQVAVSQRSAHEVVRDLLQRRITFYRNLVVAKPTNGQFLNGWINRVNALGEHLNERAA